MTEGLAPKILCVCTSNLCRSVAMELHLSRAWQEDAAVKSAGTYAMSGWEVSEVAQEVLAAEELDAGTHEPTQLTIDAINEADLVLVAATDHRAWITQRLGHLPSTVFLLTEAAALTMFAQRPHHFERSERIRSASSALHSARTQLSDVHQASILDPHRLSHATHTKVMNQIKESLHAILAWIG